MGLCYFLSQTSQVPRLCSFLTNLFRSCKTSGNFSLNTWTMDEFSNHLYSFSPSSIFPLFLYLCYSRRSFASFKMSTYCFDQIQHIFLIQEPLSVCYERTVSIFMSLCNAQLQLGFLMTHLYMIDSSKYRWPEFGEYSHI